MISSKVARKSAVDCSKSEKLDRASQKTRIDILT